MAADNGKSRKRTLSSGDGNSPSESYGSKVRAKSPPEDVTVLVKILIPSASAGVILGKGGETIIRLQTQYCTNIKMSKAGDFYPGTNDRVCVILGNPRCVHSVLNDIIDKIRDKPDAHGASTDQQIKLVVPNSTASKVIGKGGEYVNLIKKMASVHIQLSTKDADQNMVERCITIQGDRQGMNCALDMIMDKIVSDPSSSSCPNVSYFELQSQQMSGGALSNAPMAAGIHTGIIPKRPSFMLLRHMLRNNGFADAAVEEVVAAVYTLVSYGFLTLVGEGEGASTHAGLTRVLGGGGGNDVCPQPGALSANSNAMMAPVYGGSYGNGMMGPMPNSVNSTVGASGFYGATTYGGPMTGSSSMGEYGSYHTGVVSSTGYDPANGYVPGYYANAYSSEPQPFFPAAGSSAPPPPPPPPVATAAAASSVSCTDATTTTDTVEVDENIVGMLLGPTGCGIIELQTWSGASIDISKKGVYAPGTRNRIVTVTGNPMAVYYAVYYIRQCIYQSASNGVLHQQQPQHSTSSDGAYYPLPGQATR